VRVAVTPSSLGISTSIRIISGLVFIARSNASCPIGRFSDDSQVRLAFEEQPKALPKEPLILCNQQCGRHRPPDQRQFEEKLPPPEEGFSAQILP